MSAESGGASPASVDVTGVDSPISECDQGRFTRGRKRCSSQTAKRHQSDCAIRRLELPAVSFTSGRLSVCFERSVDATDGSSSSGEMQSVLYTDAL